MSKPAGPERWKLCSAARSLTWTVYVPGGMLVTRLPAPATTLIEKPGPTVPNSVGFCAPALPARASAATTVIRNRPRIRAFIRSTRAIGLRLRAQLRPEPLREQRHDPPAQHCRVLVRERPLGRLEDERERNRLLPLANLLAAVDVEHPRLAQLRTGRLARRLDERARGHVLGDDDGDVLADRRERDHVHVGRHRLDSGEERREVELEDAPRALEPRRMKLSDPPCIRARRLARVEEGLLRA